MTQLNYIPDIIFSAGFTKRSNIDDKGDFLSASLGFSLPLSNEKYSKKKKAIREEERVINKYKNYKKLKRRKIFILEKEILKFQEELKILKGKTIPFAKNSRAITSKSYGIGNTSYSEFKLELKLQKIYG